MMTDIDLTRILNSKNVKKIDNAMKACKRAQSEWGKNYWFTVWKTLCQKYGRMDLYRKDLN
jgi:hypothetical protein